jgi:tripartite-type tricarboxylate transporter receptor subunit TctC
MLHVPYKGGGPAANAVISGEVSMHFQNVPTSLPHVHERRVRALGITSSQRMSLIPDIPTIAESGLPGFETGNWYGILAPAKTSKETIATIRTAAIKVLNRPDVSKRLIDQGNVPVWDTPEEFAAHIKREMDRVGKIIRALNLKAE